MKILLLDEDKGEAADIGKLVVADLEHVAGLVLWVTMNDHQRVGRWIITVASFVAVFTSRAKSRGKAGQ